MINPIQSTASSVAWPDRLTSLVKAVWGSVTHRPSSASTSTPTASKAVLLTIRATLPPGQSAVVCLAVEGELNRYTFASLIEAASIHYSQGRRGLLLDLRQTTCIELSGLFALLSIARLYSGESLLDPEEGWAGLHWAAESVNPALGERVKLLTPSPAAAAALQGASFCRFLDHYADLEAALAAFPLA